MSAVEQTPMEIIQNLPTTSVPDKKIFIEQSRKLYLTMLESIPRSSKIEQACGELLKLAEIIYTTEHTGCCDFDTFYDTNNYNVQTGFYCGQNVKRILDSIKLFKTYGIKIEQYNPIQRRAIMSAITRQYSCIKITNIRECTVADVPEVVANLKKLREERDTYFQEQCKELVEFKEVPSSNPLEYTILLHSGFQKRFLTRRPGPSPIFSDVKGVFICKLREAILNFFEYYEIKFTPSDRFHNFDTECITAIQANDSTAISPSSTKPAIDEKELNFAAEIAVYLMENHNELENLQRYISESTEDSKPITNPNFDKFFSEVVSSNDKELLKFNSRDRKKRQLDYAKTKLTKMTPEEVTDVITKCSLWLLGLNAGDSYTQQLVEQLYKSKMIKSPKEQLFSLLNQARNLLINVEASSLQRHGGGYKRNKTKRNRKAYKTTRRNNKNKNKKQYRIKRHTKRYKKSHRRSRR